MTRRRSLDGLRGLAVLAVLASHNFPRAHGGFLGVDIFFVISGYLITAGIIREYQQTGRLDFPNFYRRRVARLLPAYLVMLVLAVPLMAGPLNTMTLLPWPVAVALSGAYVANWANAVDVGELGPLLHTWSLSVEEQYYLLWPIAFLFLLRRGRPLVQWLGAAIILTVLARTVGWALHPGLWPYFVTFTHGDGLLLGSLLAVVLAWRMPRAARRIPSHRVTEARSTVLDRFGADRFSEAWAWGGAVILAGELLSLSIDSDHTYTVGLTLSALASAVVVRHLAIAESGPMVRLLSLAPLTAIGRVSYGLYLYHMPIFLLVQSWQLGPVLTAVLELTGSAALTVASWFFVEQPVQRWVIHRWPRRDRRRAHARPGPVTVPRARPPFTPVPASLRTPVPVTPRRPVAPRPVGLRTRPALASVGVSRSAAVVHPGAGRPPEWSPTGYEPRPRLGDRPRLHR